jgi:hypothetical protein
MGRLARNRGFRVEDDRIVGRSLPMDRMINGRIVTRSRSVHWLMRAAFGRGAGGGEASCGQGRCDGESRYEFRARAHGRLQGSFMGRKPHHARTLAAACPPRSDSGHNMIVCTLRVKTGKAQTEKMFSGLPPKADLRSARL